MRSLPWSASEPSARNVTLSSFWMTERTYLRARATRARELSERARAERAPFRAPLSTRTGKRADRPGRTSPGGSARKSRLRGNRRRPRRGARASRSCAPARGGEAGTSRGDIVDRRRAAARGGGVRGSRHLLDDGAQAVALREVSITNSGKSSRRAPPATRRRRRGRRRGAAAVLLLEVGRVVNVAEERARSSSAGGGGDGGREAKRGRRRKGKGRRPRAARAPRRRREVRRARAGLFHRASYTSSMKRISHGNGRAWAWPRRPRR